MHYKDAILDGLAQRGNVAQFVSFDASRVQRFAWIRGHRPNTVFESPADAIAALLKVAPEGAVNVRSFDPADPKSKPFIYGLRTVDAVLSEIERLSAMGLYTIVNETIDIHDGGVSGVLFGDVIEFTPGDTPRGVEKPGTARFPRKLGLSALRAVYGFDVDEVGTPQTRVEFSVHPIRRGYYNSHTVVWELEEFDSAPVFTGTLQWPNNFSRLMGDKVYGLLMAWLHGTPVPRTKVIPRSLPPFEFGEPTATGETWLRTAPRDQTPGKFTTQRGWTDPFQLLAVEDTDAKVASVLSQDGVDAAYSGAAITQANGELKVEGVAGFGDTFMLGAQGPTLLPDFVRERVWIYAKDLTNNLGPVRFEWVIATTGRLYVVQLHVGASASSGDVIYPGMAALWVRFDVSRGLEALRAEIANLGSDTGIELRGEVGVTSHFGDVLRKAKIPSKLMRTAD